MIRKTEKFKGKKITANSLKKLAGLFPTKGKMTKMLLAERARDKAREDRDSSR